MKPNTSTFKGNVWAPWPKEFLKQPKEIILEGQIAAINDLDHKGQLTITVKRDGYHIAAIHLIPAEAKELILKNYGKPCVMTISFPEVDEHQEESKERA